MNVTLDQPITATCGRCGNEEAVILPDPAPRGTFYCGPCFEEGLRALLASESPCDCGKGEYCPQFGSAFRREITESEARVLDGNR